ncbi:MAG: tRNA dihydrouridine(20/20a) synthase DusA [Buchnera aphidicola (Schlechtendalia peitan)]
MTNIYKFSVAPMLHYTDRHCRFLHRQFTTQTLLYTEMITEDYLINFKNTIPKVHTYEHPIAIQIAGKNPKKLEICSRIAYSKGYDEINLNVGCPSNRVKKSGFGIYLVQNIPLLTNIIKTMVNSVPIPVSIKTRIGLDKQDDYYFLRNLVKCTSQYGMCNKYIIHARKALSNGISTKHNRTIPQLNYNMVYTLKKDFPKLTIIINGNILSIQDAKIHLKHVDGVMIGRSIYNNPSILSHVDTEMFGLKKKCIKTLIRNMYPYIEHELHMGTSFQHISRHMFGLFYGIPGCKMWKKYLSDNIYKKNSDITILENALKFVT